MNNTKKIIHFKEPEIEVMDELEELEDLSNKVKFEENNVEENNENINLKIHEIPTRPILKRQKPISYEDILSSLNMKVVDGKLQYINKNAPPPVSNRQHFEKQVIHLTKEQYQQMVLENRKKRFLAHQRLHQIKSTKMLFSNNNNHQISVSSNPNNLNKLFYFRK
jgi:hypothetical protein